MSGTAQSTDVDAEALKAFAQQCEDRHARLVAEINRVKAHEDATTATWNGDARRAFDSFMERYYYQADKVNDKLLQTVENMVKASNKFTDSDQVFQQSVQQHASSLDLPPL
ncbi:WXG100 family type VII secretion target [Nocardia xishanensis]|uniref:WXG100 family type VII secretion target n=1 Tax=Nocardia xishanensis TaxID=238964 RepID=UPI000832BCC2|nr:WXG100 family type VII secretion target [Nocardia xishanensis]